MVIHDADDDSDGNSDVDGDGKEAHTRGHEELQVSKCGVGLAAPRGGPWGRGDQSGKVD